MKEKKQPDARMAYREVVGIPPFTDGEWKEWSEAMDKKKVVYDAKDYGK